MTAPQAETPQLPTRYDVERAAEASMLPKCERDIVFALARRMDQGTTLIPGRFSPSLRGLAASTGWSKRHIQRGLNNLESLMIVSRLRPAVADARRKHARTKYSVNLERLYLAARELGTPRPEQAGDTTSTPLGTLRPVAGDSTSRGLGTEGHEARDSTSHSQTLPVQDQDTSDPELDMVIKVLRDRTGREVTEDWAAQVRGLILARPGAKGQRRLGYIRRVLIQDRDIDRWLPPEEQP